MRAENSPTWLRRVSHWSPTERPTPCELSEVGEAQGFPWFELECGAGETAEVLAALRPHCPGLTAPMLEDLLTPDDLPDGKPYADGSIQLASTFSVATERDETPGERGTAQGVGRMIFQPVEIVAGDGWLLSCWHPTRIFEGSEKVAEGPAGCADAVFRGVAECWHRDPHGTPADLGIAVMHELALTYVPTQRELMLWLEDWELSLYQDGTKADEAELTALWGLMAMMRKWLTPLNRPGLRKDVTKAWLPATDHAAVIEVDERVDRALEGLAKLSETLRQAFGLLHVEQTEAQRQREEKSARRLETLAAVFLVPTLVVGFYGANTWVPGQGRHWGFYVMVGVLALLSCATLLGLRTRRGGRSQDRSPIRIEAGPPAAQATLRR
jgi:hypothetical protein